MKPEESEHTLITALLWLSSIQYYVIQIIVASLWAGTSGYSWTNNTISDLGNTACGLYNNAYVCSPHHLLMNISFVLLGITMASGAVLLRENRKAIPGLVCMVLAGLGTILVGLFPENTIGALHVLGAGLPFTLGNLGMIALGRSFTLPRPLKIYSIALGICGLLALTLFILKIHLGLGVGGMERLTAYPQTIWLMIMGIYLLKQRFSIKKT